MNDRYLNNSQIGIVSTFSDLVHTNFEGETNALCWQRDLKGDFEAIVRQLNLVGNIMEVFPEDLIRLQLSEMGNLARKIILDDFQLLTDFGASPVLNLIKSYPRDVAFDFIATDVYSFHVDRSPIEIDTFLCTYYGEASDMLANDQAIQKIKIPEIQKKLVALHQGPIEELDVFFEENYFDLHYQAKPQAKPISLGLGNLWRLAVDHPKQQVKPCIHRAPVEKEGIYRLLLIC